MNTLSALVEQNPNPDSHLAPAPAAASPHHYRTSLLPSGQLALQTLEITRLFLNHRPLNRLLSDHPAARSTFPSAWSSLSSVGSTLPSARLAAPSSQPWTPFPSLIMLPQLEHPSLPSVPGYFLSNFQHKRHFPTRLSLIPSLILCSFACSHFSFPVALATVWICVWCIAWLVSVYL